MDSKFWMGDYWVKLALIGAIASGSLLPSTSQAVSPAWVSQTPPLTKQLFTQQSDRPQAPLLGTVWYLERYRTQDGQEIAVLPFEQITLNFGEDRVGGYDGCNSFSGSYQLQGDRLQIGDDWISTLRACSGIEEAQASNFAGVLQRAHRVAVSDRQLRLLSHEGTTIAVFSAFNPFQQTWQWRALVGQPGSARPQTRRILEFDGAGQATGRLACHRFSATYQQVGDRLTFQQGKIIPLPCVSNAVRSQEVREINLLLKQVGRYQLDGQRMNLLTQAGKPLVNLSLMTPSPLFGQTWLLQELATPSGLKPPLAGSRIDLQLRQTSDSAKGELFGNAGCNQYRAAFTLKGNQITIQPVAATRKSCAQPQGIMQQESRYLQRLTAAAQYQIRGNQLTLLDAEGRAIARFEPSSSID